MGKKTGLFPFDIKNDFVPVFATGAYPDQMWSKANPLGIVDERTLREIADSYDPGKYTAPVTKDHLHEGQSFGRIEALKVEGGKLWAKFTGLVDSFVKELSEGLYLYPSIELIDPMWSSNPTPGRWYLRAVTYLGAGVPQVMGLYEGFSATAWARFSSEGKQREAVCFDAYKEKQNSMTPEEVKALTEKIVGEKVAEFKATSDAQIAELTARNTALETAISDRDKAVAKAEKETREASVATFCTRMKKEGRYDPAFVDGEMKTGFAALIDNPIALKVAFSAYENGSTEGKLFAIQFPGGTSDATTTLTASQENMVRQFSAVAKGGEPVQNIDLAAATEAKFNALVAKGQPANNETRTQAYNAAYAEKGARR